MNGRRSRPLLIFYLLVIYVILQFSWWTYLIIDLNNQLHKERVLNANASSIQLMEKKLHKKWLMIGGEAFVFLSLLVAGYIRVRNSFKKENQVLRQQKNFLSSVTHELKSPLASVRLQAETLKKHKLTKEQQDHVLANALNDIERLDQLVENILLATRIDNPTFVLSRQEVNLTDYILECIRNFKGLFPDAVITSDLKEEIYHDIDPLLFRSVILNLFENAYRYGSKRIVIYLNDTDQHVKINVKDTGPGIPQEERENIFKVFYRIGNEDTRKQRGTGLGLYIARSLVERHDGTIQVKPNDPTGCNFEINLRKRNA